MPVAVPDQRLVLSDQLCLGSRRCRLISDDAEEPLEQWNLHFRQVYSCRDGFRIFVRIPGRTSSGSDVLGLFRDAPPHREIYQSSFLHGLGTDRCAVGAEGLSAAQAKTGKTSERKRQARGESVFDVHDSFPALYRHSPAADACKAGRKGGGKPYGAGLGYLFYGSDAPGVLPKNEEYGYWRKNIHTKGKLRVYSTPMNFALRYPKRFF